VLRIFSTLIIPAALLLLAFFMAPETGRLAPSYLLLLPWLPIGIAAAALTLCLRFNRSRIFFTVLTVALAYVVLQWFSEGLGIAGASTIWPLLCLLLPLNILVYSLLKERGTLTLWGGTRFAFLLIPFFTITGLAQLYPVEISALLHTQLSSIRFLNALDFPQVSLVTMLIALLILNGQMFSRPGAQSSALFSALIASIVMLYFRESSSDKAVFASAAILILTVALIQESWSMAYIDQLTNLPGRRALDEKMMKLGGNYSIAMIDIDHFKKFNDRHGHDAGDQVLSMVASRINQAVSGGKAFRYGGEEFTVVFPGKNVEDSIGMLDDIRKNVCDTHFQLRKKDRRHGKYRKRKSTKNVKVTVSIGVADRNERLSSTGEVIKAADKALYRAKKQGRNRVCK
jgi:diguanylate cyclase (GGDEF)-like protein